MAVCGGKIRLQVENPRIHIIPGSNFGGESLPRIEDWFWCSRSSLHVIALALVVLLIGLYYPPIERPTLGSANGPRTARHC